MTILTIAIPTYNGSDTIDVNLKKLINIKKKYPIEILVSDNCSTDNTADIVKKYDEIDYYKNNENVGFDNNCNLCVERSKGDYVWLLADNDSFNELYFEKVFSFLSNNNDLNIIFLDFKSIKGNQIKHQEENFYICKNGDVFFEKINFKNGFISSNIINRKIWLDNFMHKYFGQDWIHMEYSLRSMETNNVRAAICKLPIIYSLPIKNQKWGGNGDFIFAGLKFVKIIKTASLNYFSNETIQRGIKKIEDGYPYNLISAKIAGLKTNKNFRNEFYSVFGKTIKGNLIYFPIFICPNSFFVFFQKIYRFFVKLIKGFVKFFS